MDVFQLKTRSKMNGISEATPSFPEFSRVFLGLRGCEEIDLRKTLKPFAENKRDTTREKLVKLVTTHEK